MSEVNSEPGHDARHALECVNVILNLVPKSKKLEALDAANELFLFLEQCIHDAKRGK